MLFSFSQNNLSWMSFLTSRSALSSFQHLHANTDMSYHRRDADPYWWTCTCVFCLLTPIIAVIILDPVCKKDLYDKFLNSIGRSKDVLFKCESKMYVLKSVIHSSKFALWKVVSIYTPTVSTWEGTLPAYNKCFQYGRENFIFQFQKFFIIKKPEYYICLLVRFPPYKQNSALFSHWSISLFINI